MRVALSCWAAALVIQSLAAQPVITSSSAVNAASYSPAGLPKSAIAPGSLFTVFGKNLGPATLVSATSYPLTTTLAGTSAQVIMNGAALAPIMIFTSSGQVAMLMPSSTPAGSGTISITYMGQTSPPVPVLVGPAGFGIFTLNQAGSGPAVVTDAGYAAITLLHPAGPGQTLVLWGTGLGPISADETQAPPQGNVGSQPIVWVGTLQAKVLYWGRAGCCGGLDQINFEVPGLAGGCYVPITVQTGAALSNFGSIAVAGPGGFCSDPGGLSPAQLGLAAQGHNLNIASLSLSRSTISSPPSSTTTDFGSASFLSYTPAQLIRSSFNQQVSTGNCMVFPLPATATVSDPVQPLGLDAGPPVEVGGTNGTVVLPESSKGYYGQTIGSSTSSHLYLDVPAHTIDVFGGADVGNLSEEVQMPPALSWTGQSSIVSVSQAQGVTVAWTGAVPNGIVRVTGYSLAPASNGATGPGAAFYCSAPAGSNGAGQFFVPPPVLLSLPQTSGFLGITSIRMPSDPLSPVRGIDAGFAQTSLSLSQKVSYTL